MSKVPSGAGNSTQEANNKPAISQEDAEKAKKDGDPGKDAGDAEGKKTEEQKEENKQD